MNDDPSRQLPAWGLTVGLVLICAAEAAALLSPGASPMVLAPAPRPEMSEPRSLLPEALRTDTAFTAMMTPDDVARGVGALLALPEGDPLALSAAQRATLAPLASEGVLLKRELDALKAQRRRLELRWPQDAAEAAAGLHPKQLAAMLPDQTPATLQPEPPPPADLQHRGPKGPPAGPAHPPGPARPPERR